ncbi:MAG: FIST C-terminal domain-containing protein [Oceanospirillum sp.]|nr:FIST C-terminal domain-containing protein [Oceanospirillum sp.]
MAAEVYARSLGVTTDQLTPSIFAQHTLSVRIAGESFVRAVQSANEDGSLSFYCAVERGIVLRRNKHLNIPEALDFLLSRIDDELGDQQLILGFDCIFRQLELTSRNELNEVSGRLSSRPVVGFNTYGEHVNGIHLNATFTGVAIGRCPGEMRSGNLL